MAVWYWVGGRQTNGVQLAFRETFDAVTGITEQHAAGAVAVHQHRYQLLARGLGIFAIAVGGLQQRLDILLADQIARVLSSLSLSLLPASSSATASATGR